MTMNYVVVSSLGAVVLGFLVLFVRMKASNKPTSIKKIILPPIFMSTGACMYFIPEFRLTPMEILETVVVGMLFSILLIKTSRFEVKDNDIYLKRSKAFVFILVGLLLIRLILKAVLSTTIEIGQLSGMFFLLAYSMIVPWRLAMLANYKKVYNEMQGLQE